MVACCVWVGGAFPDASDHCVIRDFIIMKMPCRFLLFLLVPIRITAWKLVHVCKSTVVNCCSCFHADSFTRSFSISLSNTRRYTFVLLLTHSSIHSFIQPDLYVFNMLALRFSLFSLLSLCLSFPHKGTHSYRCSFIHSFIHSFSFPVCVCVCVCVCAYRSYT